MMYYYSTVQHSNTYLQQEIKNRFSSNPKLRTVSLRYFCECPQYVFPLLNFFLSLLPAQRGSCSEPYTLTPIASGLHMGWGGGGGEGGYIYKHELLEGNQLKNIQHQKSKTVWSAAFLLEQLNIRAFKWCNNQYLHTLAQATQKITRNSA